jgi:hypothetical protein
MRTDRFQSARRTGAALLIALLPATAARAQSGQAAAIPVPPQGVWPRTEARQGRYFAYAAPVGWNVSESTNGIDVMNPSANEGLNFMGLEGSRGSTTPRERIEWLFELLKTTNFAITAVLNRPSQNGFDTAEFLYSYSDAQGRPCLGWAWSAVNNAFGFNNMVAAAGETVGLRQQVAGRLHHTPSAARSSPHSTPVRLPQDFMFQLEPVEWANLKSQSTTSSYGPHALADSCTGSRYNGAASSDTLLNNAGPCVRPAAVLCRTIRADPFG